MRKDLRLYRTYQVFLNHPFDPDFETLAYAFQFAVVAANLLPVCALDTSFPDHPRLTMLVEAISNCAYSAHDLSRCKGEGAENFARMNMPIEMGMALYPALLTQRQEHRCVFFVPKPHEYHHFASDLGGLDPRCHNNSDLTLVAEMYRWLTDVAPSAHINQVPVTKVQDKYQEFKRTLRMVAGSRSDGSPSHQETREVMYKICEEAQWWDWRQSAAGRAELRTVPLAWRAKAKRPTK
jgi:hypothetical protein